MTDPKADVWMPLLIDKYLGDTTMLTTEQHGAYMLLLMSMWKSAGALPDDDRKLAAAAKLTPSRWKGMRETIRPFFRSDGQGGLVQKRLMFELQRAQARSENGKKAARSRWPNDAQAHAPPDAETMRPHMRSGMPNTMPTDMPSGCESNAERGAEGDANSMRNACSIPIPIQSDSSLRSESSGQSSSSLRSEESRPARASPGEACKAMREVGIGDVNPNNPDLRAMLEQGLTISELVSASKVAMDSNASKPFVYALSVARSARERAAKIALAPPTKRGDKLSADILAAAASHRESSA